MLLPFSIYSVAKQNWLPNLNYDDTLAHSVSLQGCNLIIILIMVFYEISPDNKIPQHNYYRKQLN